MTGSHINTAALVGQLQNAGHLIVRRGTGTHRVRHLVVCTVEVRTAGMDQPYCSHRAAHSALSSGLLRGCSTSMPSMMPSLAS